MGGSRVCELCGGDASLYCASDSAFLCFRCDADVHGANFLVARHVRSSVCSSCRSLADDRFCGAGVWPRPAFCRSCSGERTGPRADDSESLSSGSDCVSCTGSAAVAAPAKIRAARKRELVEIFSSSSSPTESSGKGSARLPSGEVSSSGASRMDRGRNRSVPAVNRIDARAEGILGIWRQRMGLSESSVAEWAARALGSCGGELTALPLRVLLAASFWLGLRTCSSGCKSDTASWQAQIKRLEEVSGVPSRLIVAAAARLARAGGVRRLKRGLEEGFGEC